MKQFVFFLLIIFCTPKVFTQVEERKVVSLPFELHINRNESMLITEDGFIRFGDKVFVYNENGKKYPIHESMITIYCKGNLCGLDIMEETSSGGFIGHTIIINTKTKEEISFERPSFLRLWGFFSIENCFILASAEKSYAFEEVTGELLWTQTYRQKDGRRIIKQEDHLIIDDLDGSKYKIYGNGQKVKL